MHPMNLEPTTSPSIPLLWEEELRKCHLSYSSLAFQEIHTGSHICYSPLSCANKSHQLLKLIVFETTFSAITFSDKFSLQQAEKIEGWGQLSCFYMLNKFWQQREREREIQASDLHFMRCGPHQ